MGEEKSGGKIVTVETPCKVTAQTNETNQALSYTHKQHASSLYSIAVREKFKGGMGRMQH